MKKILRTFKRICLVIAMPLIILGGYGSIISDSIGCLSSVPQFLTHYQGDLIG